MVGVLDGKLRSAEFDASSIGFQLCASLGESLLNCRNRARVAGTPLSATEQRRVAQSGASLSGVMYGVPGIPRKM